MGVIWPLTGRAAELARLRRLVAVHEHAGVVLVGPAGVGKTRLAKECLAVGEEAGYATALAVASRSARGIPLGALATLLPARPEAAASGVGLLQYAQEGLAQLAGDRPLLLVVDDAHNLDDTSAVLLQQLAVSRSAFIVATVRTGELVPEPVAALWKEGLAERIELDTLDAEATENLLEAALAAPVEAIAVRQLWEASRGNVLYLRELVLSALETHNLVDDAGLWRIVGEVSASPRLRDLVEVRVAGLDEDEVAALELVAFGEPVDLAVIERLGVTAAVERLERKSIVAISEDGDEVEVRLAHPLHGDVLRDRTPVIRSRQARRLLADAVEEVGAGRPGDVLRVALWRLDGGGAIEPDALVAGAALAGHAFDYATAERLARAAFEAEPSFAAGYILAGAMNERGDAAGVEVVLAQLSELTEGDDDKASMAGLRVANLFWRARDLESAITVGEEIAAGLTEEEARNYVISQVAVVEASAGRAAASIERVSGQLSAVGGRAFYHAALAGTLALPLLGRALEGAEVAQRGIDAHTAMGVQGRIFEVSLMDAARCIALFEAGEVDEATSRAETGFDEALRNQDDVGRSQFALALGLIHLDSGDAHDAVRRFREAEARFRRDRHDGMTRWALGGQLFAQALLRDVDAAHAVIHALDEVGPHPAGFTETILLRARAWLLVAEHDLAGALVQLQAAAGQAARDGQPARELPALHDQARLGDPAEVVARARVVAGGVAGTLAPARLAHIEALAAGDAAALTAAADLLEARGLVIAAAEAMVAAADASRSAGDGRRAAACVRRSQELAARCEGVVTPGLVQTDAIVPLTKREREIALLGAEGLSSRQIAERLVVSIRTVDNHLARIYDKLGVSGRSELADALRPLE